MAVSPPGTPAISGERNSDKETFPSCGNFHAPCGCQLGPTRETGSSRRCPGARVHIHPTKHLAGYQALMGKLHADSPLASRSLSGCSRTQQTQHRRRPSRMGPAVAARHCLGPPHPHPKAKRRHSARAAHDSGAGSRAPLFLHFRPPRSSAPAFPVYLRACGKRVPPGAGQAVIPGGPENAGPRRIPAVSAY